MSSVSDEPARLTDPPVSRLATNAEPFPGFVVLPAVTGDLDTIAMLDECDALGDGQLACLLAAANGQLHVLQYLARRGYDLRKSARRARALAAANERQAVVRFLQGLCELDAEGATVEETADLERSAARDAAAARPGFPTVSILLANYNHARYLDTSLSGIFTQRHPATEVIIVDDGSTDNSVEVIRSYANRYPNLQLLLNEGNRGQYYSIQRALHAATGDYVVWASSDDLLLPRFIERSLQILKQHPQAGLCFSRLAVFVDGSTATRIYTGDTDDKPFDYGAEVRYLSPGDLVQRLRRHYLWISGNTVLAKREALLEMGGFEGELRWHADWFAYYVVALRYGACMIPETLAMMRERRGTYSANGMHAFGAQQQVLTSLLDLIKRPKYQDLLPAFRRCPSLFAPFGVAIARASLAAPRHYDLAWSMTRWFGPRFFRRKLAQFLSISRIYPSKH